MNVKQEQLNRLYLEYLDRILSDKEIFYKVNNFTFSSPLFIDLKVKNGNVSNKKHTLLFIGQQTKGWLNRDERKNLDIRKKTEYLKALRKLYIEFNYGDRLEGQKYNGYLWQFQRPLIETVNEKNKDSFGLLWSNLMRIDENQDKIDNKNTIEKIAYKNNEILKKEIEIIRPDAIVFVTGCYYDWLLKKTFKDLTFYETDNKDLNLKKLAILKSNFLPKLTFRTYHPRPLYQNRYLKNSRTKIIETIAEIIMKELNN
ncbi:MAG: hypothetical protein KAT68_12815 [Bacteroidales bacterium]|nr:hypothetical protein [Bacteroidales bacterium]